jgi:hypothetical protein
MLINKSGGTVNESSGLYAAGASPGVTDIVRVIDSWGNVSDASVSVIGIGSATSTGKRRSI